MEVVKYKKRLAALPYDPGMFVNYVNKTHFQKAGLTMFDTRTPATWEDVLEAGKRLVVEAGGEVKQ